MKRSLTVGLTGVCLVAALSRAQDTTTPKAKPDDVKSIDAIVKALYDTISGDKGQQRDWDRLRSLFAPGARLTIAVPAREAGQPAALRTLQLEDFIKSADASSKREAFYESELSRRVDEFGRIANVWSTYESRTDPMGKPFMRGINSFELFNDGTRWWVVSIYWTNESADQPIPEKYRANTK